MENKKLAIKEKELAEELIKMKDYHGAREGLYKAQSLFPSLENISQMITACRILCAAKATVGGGPNWYWVLLTNGEVDESQIATRHEKLTMLLQPIKNKFFGTEIALSLIDKAFVVLSDRRKRSAFDFERTLSLNCANVNLQSSPDGILAEREAPERNKKMTNSREIDRKRPLIVIGDRRVMEGGVKNSSIGMEHEVSTRQGEVNAVSFNTKTRGSDKIKTPVANGKLDLGSSSISLFRVVNRTGTDTDYFDFENNRKIESFGVGQIWAVYDQEKLPRSYARISKVNYQLAKLSVTWLKPAPVASYEKKWCEVRLPVACGYFNLPKSNMVVSEWKVFSHCISKGSTDEHIQVVPKKGDVWAIYKNWQPSAWCLDPQNKKDCGFLMVEILKNYSENEVLVVAVLEKVAGFKSIFKRCIHEGSDSSFWIPARDLYRFSHNVPAFRFTGTEMENISNGMLELDPLVVPTDLVDHVVRTPERSTSAYSSFTLHPSLSSSVQSDEDTPALEPKWSKKDFISGHIWAAYDDPDSMPRRYVSVKNVISENVVCATFLEPIPTFDDETHWVEENLPFGCGIFRSGKIASDMKMSLFSHLVTCQRSTTESLYKIFPKKGEIWAMYKNWNAKWKQTDYSHCQCQIVEILNDFCEATEIRIVGLVAVMGYTTFFQRQLCNGFELTRTILSMEVLSFSHQIPAYVVPGAQEHGIPKDALHLEPDALPLNLTN